jgi:integrase
MTEPTEPTEPNEPKRRQRRPDFTDNMVAELPRKRRRYIMVDPEQRGLYIRVPPEGPCVFAAVARNPHAMIPKKGGGEQPRQVWTVIGTADVMKIEEARERARGVIKRVKAGLPAREPPPPKPVEPASFQAVAQNWLKRYVEKNELRSAPNIKRLLSKIVYPRWADRDFISLRRSDINDLLDYVEDHHGERQADLVLAIIRGIANWFTTRDDAYISPVVKGMKRVPKGAGKRSRILSNEKENDRELRAVWLAAERGGTFGAFVRLALLTAQRRDVLVHMKWDDIDDNGVWHIPQVPKEKGNGGDLKLPPSAMAIIQKQPRLAGNPYVFAGRGGKPWQGFANAKPAFDKAADVHGWVVHDLRRTSRSLLSRKSVGVLREHAERVLGHRIRGVEGTYDQHPYTDEKADALAKLAALIERIVAGPTDNVITGHFGAHNG